MGDTREGRAANVLVVAADPRIGAQVAALARRLSAISIVGHIAPSPDLVSRAQALKAEVVIVDISAAGIRGLEIIYRLRTQAPELRIIAVSSCTTASCSRSACECGADVFIRLSELETRLLPALVDAAS